MYRPEFAYATPPRCRDEDFVYSFDATNVPLLASISAGQVIDNIPLVLDRDAPFYWRGYKFGLKAIATFAEGPATVAYQFPDVNMILRDCYENNLSDTYVPATQGGFSMNPLQFLGSVLTGPPTLLEPEIYCPPGGVILAFLQGGATLIAAGATTSLFLPTITLFGVKRYKECNS